MAPDATRTRGPAKPPPGAGPRPGPAPLVRLGPAGSASPSPRVSKRTHEHTSIDFPSHESHTRIFRVSGAGLQGGVAGRCAPLTRAGTRNEEGALAADSEAASASSSFMAGPPGRSDSEAGYRDSAASQVNFRPASAAFSRDEREPPYGTSPRLAPRTWPTGRRCRDAVAIVVDRDYSLST